MSPVWPRPRPPGPTDGPAQTQIHPRATPGAGDPNHGPLGQGQEPAVHGARLVCRCHLPASVGPADSEVADSTVRAGPAGPGRDHEAGLE